MTSEQIAAALEPFTTFAETFIDDQGWTGPMNKERIVDWFGPSDFRRARQALAALSKAEPTNPRWPIGAKVRKKRGSSWRGTVCGYYSTPHTPQGYCVDSAFEPGSVQVWPEAALEEWNGE